MRTLASVVLAASFAVFALACSSSSSGPETEGSVAAAATASGDGFCEAMCKKTSSCDSAKDADTCTRACKAGIAPELAKLRHDVVSSAQACLVAADCKETLDGSALGDCLGEAFAEVTPSQAAKDLCTALAASNEKCGNETIDRARCLNQLEAYADPLLLDAKTCTEKACSAVWSCMDATF